MTTRVRFLRDELYESEGRGKGHTFKAGEVYDFDDAFAQRWVRREAVEVLEGGPPAPEHRFTPATDGKGVDAAAEGALAPDATAPAPVAVDKKAAALDAAPKPASDPEPAKPAKA